MDILQKIEKYRLQMGWSMYKLSIESGLAQSTLQNMYARGTLPSLSTLQNICDAFGITLAQFFDDDNSEKVLVSADENDLLNDYRKLSENSKEIVCSLLKNLQ